MTCLTLYWYMFIIKAVSKLVSEELQEPAGIPEILMFKRLLLVFLGLDHQQYDHAKYDKNEEEDDFAFGRFPLVA